MLTTEQIAARRGRLTASRVACLMAGDKEAIINLWLEMVESPLFQPEDFSTNWPVRLGEATEPLNLLWYQMRNAPVSRRGEVAIHPTEPWAAATLDGWDDILKCPIECKHVGGREPLEIIFERYAPQTQWQMYVTGSTLCALSVIVAASPPIVEYLDRDDDYIAEMVARGRQFMTFVERRIEPLILPRVTPIMATKTVDMSGDAVWTAAANQWLQCYGAAQTARDCEKTLKSIMPPDARKAFGAGVVISRDRADRLSLRKDKESTA